MPTLLFTCACLIFSQLRMAKVGFILTVPFIVLIATLRGDVGVDTYSYLVNIDNIISNDINWFVFEPGFISLMLLFDSLGLESRGILIVISLLITLILFCAFFKLEKGKPYILFFLVIPVFYFDMTMNGLRYGLSFSLVALGCSYLNINQYQYHKNKVFFFFILLATSIQFTGLLLGLLVYYVINGRVKIGLYISLFIVFLILVLDYFSVGFISDKFNAYSNIQSPTAGSGLTTAFISLLTIFILMYFERGLKRRRTVILYLTVLSIISFIISQVSYAGLRLQSLVLFLTFLIYAMNSDELQLRKGSYLFMLSIIGVLGFLFKLKNFIDGENVGATPFIPYMFIWELYDF